MEERWQDGAHSVLHHQSLQEACYQDHSTWIQHPSQSHGGKLYIEDQLIDEIILVRKFFYKIGFNLIEHLNLMVPHIHDRKVDNIETADLKVAAKKYQGLSYMEADEDPIGLPDSISAGIGNDANESIDNVFQHGKVEAQKKGLSDEGLATLITTLETYPAVFHIKLGPDPPAKVAPVVPNKIDNAIPYRSPQRRYSPPTANSSFVPSASWKMWVLSTRTHQLARRALHFSFRSQVPLSYDSRSICGAQTPGLFRCSQR